MRRVLPIAVMLVACLALVAQAETTAKAYDVTKDGTQFKLDGASSAAYRFDLGPAGSDYIEFRNQSGETIYVVCKQAPDTKPLKYKVTISNGGTGRVNFNCPTDHTSNKDWWFEVGDDSGTDTEAFLTVKVICGTPATGTIGIVVLGLLLAGTAAFLLMRRRSLA